MEVRREQKMLTGTLLQRFLTKVNHLPGENACWLWMAGNTYRYGVIREDGHGRQLLAHRVAWEFANGPIPRGAVVRHKCDNSLCVRPSHLEIGTTADNNRDMAARRRGRKSGAGLPYGVRSVNGGRQWMARVSFPGGGRVYLGTFPTAEEASAIVERERTRLYGPLPETERAA
jgi:hypothetical protein